MRLRRYRLEEASEAILRRARFRAPQAEAFKQVHRLVESLSDDVARLTDDRLLEELRRQALNVPEIPAQLVLALATGVGKTLLMGGLIDYFYLARQSQNFLVLASRTAILEKLEREAQIGHSKYLFIDRALIPEPNLCFRSNIESFTPTASGPNVFILSPQSITGADKRFARGSEFRGFSLLQYLRECEDLVVFMDEAHHLAGEDAAWTQALRELKPKLYFGLTATPRRDPDVHVLYEYDLATCLHDAQFTKGVSLLVEPREERFSEQDWDRYTMDFALRRLERKRKALRIFSEEHKDFSFIEPVLLLCAKDTNHAEEVATWLKEKRGLADDEILVTHSERARTESDIKRLVSIDQPSNMVRIVVNVFQLTEGWDVTNVYVVTPLRAMATFVGAVQTMGRGLRLPAGKRVGEPDIDTLEVLCCGKESLEEILQQATDQFLLAGEEGLPVDIATRKEQEEKEPDLSTKEYVIGVRREVTFKIPRVRRVPADPPLDFDIVTTGDLTKIGATTIDLATLETFGGEEGISYDLEQLIRLASDRIVAELPYLSDPIHGQSVEALVRNLLMGFGEQLPDRGIALDPMKVALFLRDEIDRRYRQMDAIYETLPEIDEVQTTPITWRVPEDFEKPGKQVQSDEWR